MRWQRGMRAGSVITAVLWASFASLSWSAGERAHARHSGPVEGLVELHGTVTYQGTPPAAQPIDMSADPYCAGEHAGDAPVAEPIALGANGRLRNAFVYVKQGVPAQKQPVPAEPVLLDQRGCTYQPAVLALRAGQTLLIRNSDATLHNVHVTARQNRGFNIGQPIRGLEAKRTFDRPEIGIAAACDIHGWMSATLAVFDHPYFAVTAEDGTFSIAGLAAGEYELEVWHRTLGTQAQRVTVTAGRPTTVELSYSAR